MEFLKKYWLILLVIVLVIVYFIFKAKIDKWLGIAQSLASSTPSWVGCDKTFFVKLPDGKTQSIFATDEGTTDNPVPVYYKNDVTFVQDGIKDPGTPVKITKEEFDGFCQYLYHPPYPWYTEESKGGTSAGTKEGHSIKTTIK